MNGITRRSMIRTTSGALLTMPFTGSSGKVAPAADWKRKFTLDLNWGAIGVGANQVEAIEYAAKYGFESVAAHSGFLLSLGNTARTDLMNMMTERGVVWGAAALPVDFRKDETTFKAGLKKLSVAAKAMQLAGVTRVSTWLMPCHGELTYMSNFRQHARRLRECVKILGDHGQRFGLEYVGPKTLWASKRHSFIHSMNETKDLIAEIGKDNVGFVLDSWHWYTAHETADDLRTLTNDDIVACDLNDAPAGIAIDEQIDSQRELPSASGVIDLKTFLGVLVEIGYDGPVRAEPFNAKLRALENDDACRATSMAMKKSFSLVGG